MTTKFYARRDSATTVLRKAGINPRDYNLYLTKSGDGVELNLTLLAIHAATKDTPAIADVAAKTPAKTPTAHRETVSSVARDLILAGKPNNEVWEVLKVRFELADSKRHYPSWYRAELTRKGLLA